MPQLLELRPGSTARVVKPQPLSDEEKERKKPLKVKQPRVKRSVKPKPANHDHQQPQYIPRIESRARKIELQSSVSKQKAAGDGGLQPPLGDDASRLQLAFVQAVENLRLQNSWVASVIPRLGTDGVIDTAAKAVIQAHIHATHSPTGKPMSDANTSYYLQALTSLRENLFPSDSTLVAVALLALYETVLRGADHAACQQHWMGVAAVALAKSKAPGQKSWSEAARAVLAEYWVSLGSRMACAKGLASPFDNDEDGWLDLDPVFGGPGDPVPDEAVKLRKHTHGDKIRFPRLLSMVRTLRRQRDPDAYPEAEATIKLARKLLQYANHAAESNMLHRVKVARTLNPADRAVTLFSYEFHSEGEISSCILYWASRLSTIKLCLVINETLSRSPPPPFDTDDLEKEQARIATNIVMSWQDGFKRDIFGRYMSQSIFVTHLALKNFKTFRGKPVAHTRHWLLECFHKAAAVDWPGLEPNEEEMDEATAWIAGGETVGFMGGYAIKPPKSVDSDPMDESVEGG